MRERIKTAIEMILQNKGEDWFIIIEEPEKEKFVQFTFDEGSGLYFDLPFQALDKSELERARKVLAEFSIFPGQADAYETHAEEKSGIQESFNHHVGQDLDLAVKISCRVFVDVFGYDESVSLNVTIMR
ncbi:MAG: hypothetical protein PHD82_15585 [Candidatus Riflebacteria bacterium]|nr:hypothetical protein [Candidatus Riflebacteria bacterium]